MPSCRPSVATTSFLPLRAQRHAISTNPASSSNVRRKDNRTHSLLVGIRLSSSAHEQQQHDDDEGDEDRLLFLTLPSLPLARTVGASLVELGLARTVSLWPSTVETWMATDDGKM